MKEKRAKYRKSNFELLRILAMLGIIVYHLVLHHLDYNRFALIDETLGSNFYHLEIIQLFYTLGQIGNTLFILITGYFLIERKEHINVVKSGTKLLNRSYFLAIILLGISYLLARLRLPFSSNSDIHMALNGWWFVGYYLFIIIFAKYVLNRFLNGLDKKAYLNFILSLTILLSFMEVFNVLTNLKIQNFVIGILIYSIGGFLRLYSPFKKVKLRIFLLFILGFTLIQVVQYKVNLQTNLRQFYNAPEGLFVSSPFTNILWSPSILFTMCSVCIFEVFNRIKIGSIRWINTLSAATFTVYLFHESSFFRKLHFQGLPLPNRLGVLKTVSTKILAEGPDKGTAVPLNNPEMWIDLKDFLNISQVLHERGLKTGVLYIILLTVGIFFLGIVCEFVIQLLNKIFKSIFVSDFMKIKRNLRS
jgi:hypothetical protein